MQNSPGSLKRSVQHPSVRDVAAGCSCQTPPTPGGGGLDRAPRRSGRFLRTSARSEHREADRLRGPELRLLRDPDRLGGRDRRLSCARGPTPTALRSDRRGAARRVLDARGRRRRSTTPQTSTPRSWPAPCAALGVELGVPVSDAEAESLARSVPDWPAFPDSAGRAASGSSQRFKLIILSNVDRASFAGSNQRLGVDVHQHPHRAGHRLLQARAAQLRGAHGRGDAAGGRPRASCCTWRRASSTTMCPAKAAGLPTVWINRRHDRPRLGCHARAPCDVTPDWTFPSMAAFADAVDAEKP